MEELPPAVSDMIDRHIASYKVPLATIRWDIIQKNPHCMLCDKPCVANEYMNNPNTFVNCGVCGLAMHIQCFLNKASLRASELFTQKRVICTQCDSQSITNHTHTHA